MIETQETQAYLATLTPGQRRTWETQEAFLTYYVEWGTVKDAARLAGTWRQNVDKWCQSDAFDFNARYAIATQDRRDRAERKYVLDRLDNPKGNYGTDVLAIAYMNRLDPENWTRGVRVTHDVPNELIQQLRALQSLSEPKKELAEPKTVEGEVMPWE